MAHGRFCVGDKVEIARISGVGTVVALDGDFARVQMTGVVVKLPVGDLKPHSPGAGPKVSETDMLRRVKLHSPALEAGPAALFSLDLHGKTTADAIDLLEQQISRAVMAGMHEIEIVHGIGTGRVRQVVHARLALLSAVARFEIKFTNHGVTRVFLRA